MQVNLKNKAEYTVCPYQRFKKVPVFGCPLNCDRYAGKDSEFVKCGKPGENKDILLDRSNPRVHQRQVTYGDNLEYVCGAYDK